MFFKFMGAASPGPGGLVVGGDGLGVFGACQHGAWAVFGGKDSAFAVVTNTEVANWQDLGRSADTLNTTKAERRNRNTLRDSLSALWVDFVNGALTLADGAAAPRGWSRSLWVPASGCRQRGDAVPSAAEQFSAIPTSLSAVIGALSRPADVLGAANLRERLQQTYSDPAAGVEARTGTTSKLARGCVEKLCLAGQLDPGRLSAACRSEVAQLAGQIQQAANVSADGRLRARQRAISVILKTVFWSLLLVLVVLAGIAVLGWVPWPFALWTAG